MIKKTSLLIFLTLLIGITFRFYHLDHKVHWNDEIYTSLRISGHTETEFYQTFSTEKVFQFRDIQLFQTLNSQKGITDTVRGLAIEEPQLSPLYFAIVRLWSEWFGDTIGAVRSLSAVFSLCALPLMYWLCIQLFESPQIGWMAVAISAISPFNILFSQAARPYSLWLFTILLSNIALLRYLKSKTFLNWLFYTTTLIFGLYSHLFTILVIAGHSLYVLATYSLKSTKTIFLYFISILVSFLLLTPWIVIILINLGAAKETSSWSFSSMSVMSLVNEWMRNISYGFSDFWYIFTYFPDSTYNFSFAKFFIPAIILLVLYSFYFLFRHTPVKSWLFVYTLTLSTALPIVFLDLVFSGYRSIMAKYFIPCYIGMHLAVAYLLVKKTVVFSKEKQFKPLWSNLQARFWRLATAVLLLLGVISGVVGSQSKVWWLQRTTPHDLLLSAQILNTHDNSLLMLEPDFAIAANLSAQIKPDLSFMFVDTDKTSLLHAVDSSDAAYSDFFVLSRASDEIESTPNFKAEVVYSGRKVSLWQLK